MLCYGTNCYGYKENKTCTGDKKDAWQKSAAKSLSWNEYWRPFHTADDMTNVNTVQRKPSAPIFERLW